MSSGAVTPTLSDDTIPLLTLLLTDHKIRWQKLRKDESKGQNCPFPIQKGQYPKRKKNLKIIPIAQGCSVSEPRKVGRKEKKKVTSSDFPNWVKSEFFHICIKKTSVW